MTHLKMTDEEYAALEQFAAQWHGEDLDLDSPFYDESWEEIKEDKTNDH